mgnify:CR=1 FL=1
MKNTYILLVLGLFVSSTLLAQQGWEAGAWLGGSHYFGDLNTAYDNLLSQAEYMLKDHNRTLDNYTQMLEMTLPKNVMKRGFAMVKNNKTYVGKIKDIKKSDKDLTIEFYDGEIQVTKRQRQ